MLLCMNELGKFLASSRRKVKMTQLQVANLLGVNPNNVSGYETGLRPISDEMLAEMAKILGLDHEELIALKLIDSKPKKVIAKMVSIYLKGLEGNT